jgi:hypothetical protein
MRILIAEDHDATRLILEAAVRSLGHDCVAANDGEEAWQLFVPSLRSPLKHSTHRKWSYAAAGLTSAAFSFEFR